MKTLNVVAAVIEDKGKILIAQRKKGDLKGLWEFPGGKIEEGETLSQALIREIMEEFSTRIKIKSFLKTIEHQYEDFYLVMDCYICEIEEGELILHDHSAYRWITPDETDIDWVEADKKVIAAYRQKIS